MNDLRVTANCDTHDVDDVEEAGCIPPEEEGDGDKDEEVVVHVWYAGDEWVARAIEPSLDYEGRADRKWGAIRDLFETVDERARRFGF